MPSLQSEPSGIILDSKLVPHPAGRTRLGMCQRLVQVPTEVGIGVAQPPAEDPLPGGLQDGAGDRGVFQDEYIDL